MSKDFCNLSLSIKRKAHKLYPLASWLFFLRICKIAALGNNWSPPVLFWRKDLPMFKPVCTFISFLSKMPRTRKQLRQTQILALILYYPYTRSAVHILIFSRLFLYFYLLCSSLWKSLSSLLTLSPLLGASAGRVSQWRPLQTVIQTVLESLLCQNKHTYKTTYWNAMQL